MTRTFFLLFALLCLGLIGCDPGEPAAEASADTAQATPAAPPTEPPAEPAPPADEADPPEPEPEPEPAEAAPPSETPAPSPEDAAPKAPVDQPSAEASETSTPPEVAEGIQEIERLTQLGQFNEALAAAEALYQAHEEAPIAPQLSQRVAKLRGMRRDAVQVQFAVQQLSGPNARVAASRLGETGPVGQILLRRAVREGDPVAAVEAARVLARSHNEAAADEIARRLLEIEQARLGFPMAEALAKLAPYISEPLLPKLHAQLEGDEKFDHRGAAHVLARVYLDELEAQQKAYNEAVDDESGLTQLRSYIEAAIGYKNAPHVQRWATELAAPLGVLVPGLRGTYYAGKNYDRRMFERIDERIHFGNRNDFPLPDKKIPRFTVTWVGQLQVPETGTYEFELRSDDGHRLWIDQEPVVDKLPGGPAHTKKEVSLTEGPHEVRVDLQERGGRARISAHWSGPGVKRRLLSAKDVSAVPVVE